MFKGQKRCSTPVLDEERIKRMFMEAYYQLENSREKVIADVKEMLLTIVDFTAIDKQIDTREEKLEEISTLVRAEIQNNAIQANMQDSFDAKLERLRERYDATEAALADLRQQKLERLNRQR